MKQIVFSILFAATTFAQTPSPDEVAKALGFTAAEVTQIKNGELVSKALTEGSDKELAGVVAVMFKKPLAELVEIAIQGKLLESDKTIQAFHSWKPEISAAEAFAKIGLSATETDEAEIYSRASAGDKLNLSKAEIEPFRKAGKDVDAVNTQLRAMLKARYEAYRQSGLKGITPYTRGRDEARPAEELALAIKETMSAGRRLDYFQALLDYPAKPLPEMRHQFFWFKQTVENRPTFILADRAELQTPTAALITEVQYYVSHSYNSNFIAGGCLEVQGGTLVFYVNRTFTDQVAGMMSSVKHGIGRGQMLGDVKETLERARTQFQK